MEAPTVAAPVLTHDTSPELNSSTSTIVHTLATATSNTAASLGYSALTSPMMLFTTATDTTSPSEADIIEFFHLANSSYEIYQPVEYSVLRNLPTIAEYMAWEEAQPIGDPLDILAKRAIFVTADGIFRTPFHCHQRFLPFEAELHDISPDSVPFPIREIRCLEIRLKAVLPRLIGTGMLIPARAGHGRAMALAPFFKDGCIQYILCLHGNCDVFLMRTQEYSMDVHWSNWEQLKATYGQGNFTALFSADMYTLEGRMEGVRRQRDWLSWRL
ncbi:hypothetical protein BDP27DRAFT_1425693 [Rhodocollybia butyracea]|uniref:Uncharacterized protein n=1 Tax=Rhodocollybia butyracea TaxID=206335 RepID=A0A9P5PL86_9AGAR|nr:hypothetical protein BDP27DRAFT_1425693 [Rhodocollybia butyracea]